MSVPQPPIALEGHCATIHDSELYVLSPGGFQSLPLQHNATWSQQPNGTAVTSPACVKAVQNGNDSTAQLYVIGGTASNSTYRGLQRFSFDSNSWETLSPQADVLQGRTQHSAAYLNESQTILIYAGSQPDAPSEYSSQTFLLSTQPPYDILSYSSDAPPLNQPIIQPWNSSHAVMVGGSASNTEVWTFGPNDGWVRYDTNLTKPLDSSARALVIDSSDGAKVLQLYNVTASPNTVSAIVLSEADGSPAATGQLAGSNSTTNSTSSSRKRKRDLSLNNWPQYNSTDAPTVTRTDCALAQDAGSGLVAIAGGSTALPVALFSSDNNTWVDANKFFGQTQQPLLSSSTTSSITSSTASPTPSSTAAAGSSGSNNSQRNTTLGIALGVVVAFIALFVLILLLLRWRREKSIQAHARDGEKDRMDFADRGASFMKEAGGRVEELPPPSADRYRPGHDSNSSLAIMSGGYGNGHARDSTKTSFESTSPLTKQRSHANESIVEMMDLPPSQHSNLSVPTSGQNRRSTGWSRYFETNATGTTGLKHIPSVYIEEKTYSVGSDYSEDKRASRLSRIPSSALLSPMDVDFTTTVDGQRLSRVVMNSPAISEPRDSTAPDVARKASIVNPARKSRNTTHSVSSYGDNRSTVSTVTSDWYTSQHANATRASGWSPTAMSFKDHLVNEHAGSNPYRNTSTANDPEVNMADRPRPSASRGKNSGFFPGTGTSPAYKSPGRTRPSREYSMAPTVMAMVDAADAPTTPTRTKPPPFRLSTRTSIRASRAAAARAEAAETDVQLTRTSTHTSIKRDAENDVSLSRIPTTTWMEPLSVMSSSVPVDISARHDAPLPPPPAANSDPKHEIPKPVAKQRISPPPQFQLQHQLDVGKGRRTPTPPSLQVQLDNDEREGRATSIMIATGAVKLTDAGTPGGSRAASRASSRASRASERLGRSRGPQMQMDGRGAGGGEVAAARHPDENDMSWVDLDLHRQASRTPSA